MVVKHVVVIELICDSLEDAEETALCVSRSLKDKMGDRPAPWIPGAALKLVTDTRVYHR